jgi:hypothetical protein
VRVGAVNRFKEKRRNNLPRTEDYPGNWLENGDKTVIMADYYLQ